MQRQRRPRSILVALILLETILVGSAAASICLPRTHHYRFHANATDRFQHKRGLHESYTAFNYVCECDDRCRSSCTPNLSDSKCIDRGELSVTGRHRPLTRHKLTGGSKPNALITGAPCGSGFACFIQYCPAGLCGQANITGSAQPVDVGVKVSFTASIPTVWDGQLDWPFECDECELKSSLPGRAVLHDDPCAGDCADTDGGSGGGLGGGGVWCYFWCRSITMAGGTAYEVCDLVCY